MISRDYVDMNHKRAHSESLTKISNLQVVSKTIEYAIVIKNDSRIFL